MLINIPREESVISLLSSYLQLGFEVIKRADKSRYANGKDIRLVNLGAIVVFSSFQMTTSKGKHLEDKSQVHIFSLMYKLLTSSRSSDDLFIEIDQDHGRRQQGLTNNKDIKGENHVKNMLKDVFGFAEHHKKATRGLGYKLTKRRINHEAPGIADARNKIDHLHWYTPNYTPSIQKQDILSEQNFSRTLTERR